MSNEINQLKEESNRSKTILDEIKKRNHHILSKGGLPKIERQFRNTSSLLKSVDYEKRKPVFTDFIEKNKFIMPSPKKDKKSLHILNQSNGLQKNPKNI